MYAAQSYAFLADISTLSVCAYDADLTVCSSDNVLFKVHRKNLEAHSGVFAGAGDATRPENGDEVVELSETANVLDALFQFMYAPAYAQPDLRSMDFMTFEALAEAAEKYMVYSALKICRTQMEDSMRMHPLQVFLYAVRHDHISLVNDSVQQSMCCAIPEARQILPPDTFSAWVG
ncbi:hypothetical protein K438DRAFT_1600640 [Mycena galopus ATCC 62051]|nr:hypothetical protein K438DRAFT_1600640 [Mycena galopus ATCC 62051]